MSNPQDIEELIKFATLNAIKKIQIKSQQIQKLSQKYNDKVHQYNNAVDFETNFRKSINEPTTERIKLNKKSTKIQNGGHANCPAHILNKKIKKFEKQCINYKNCNATLQMLGKIQKMDDNFNQFGGYISPVSLNKLLRLNNVKKKLDLQKNEFENDIVFIDNKLEKIVDDVEALLIKHQAKIQNKKLSNRLINFPSISMKDKIEILQNIQVHPDDVMYEPEDGPEIPLLRKSKVQLRRTSKEKRFREIELIMSNIDKLIATYESQLQTAHDPSIDYEQINVLSQQLDELKGFFKKQLEEEKHQLTEFPHKWELDSKFKELNSKFKELNSKFDELDKKYGLRQKSRDTLVKNEQPDIKPNPNPNPRAQLQEQKIENQLRILTYDLSHKTMIGSTKDLPSDAYLDTINNWKYRTKVSIENNNYTTNTDSVKYMKDELNKMPECDIGFFQEATNYRLLIDENGWAKNMTFIDGPRDLPGAIPKDINNILVTFYNKNKFKEHKNMRLDSTWDFTNFDGYFQTVVLEYHNLDKYLLLINVHHFPKENVFKNSLFSALFLQNVISSEDNRNIFFNIKLHHKLNKENFRVIVGGNFHSNVTNVSPFLIPQLRHKELLQTRNVNVEEIHKFMEKSDITKITVHAGADVPATCCDNKLINSPNVIMDQKNAIEEYKVFAKPKQLNNDNFVGSQQAALLAILKDDDSPSSHQGGGNANYKHKYHKYKKKYTEFKSKLLSRNL